jgi:hypothetical protein
MLVGEELSFLCKVSPKACNQRPFTGIHFGYSLKSQERVQLENGRLMPKTASILEVARIQSVWPLKTAE